MWQHRQHFVSGFTAKYKVTLLVWYELHPTMRSAITREKAIKEWRRKWKLDLIEAMNPDWVDLYPALAGQAADP